MAKLRVTFLPNICGLLLISQQFLGCNQVREANKICLIGSRTRDTTSAPGVLQSILFIEDHGSLFAKLLQCGEKEYYLGSSPMSNSTAALGAEYFNAIDSNQWDKTISCSDAVSTFPYNEKSTTDLLRRLCSSPMLAAFKTK